jgi:valyl-tRNA synthetase
VQLVVAEGLEAFLPLAGLVDLEKERERLTKQAAKLEGEVNSLQQRLSSPKVRCLDVTFSSLGKSKCCYCW